MLKGSGQTRVHSADKHVMRPDQEAQQPRRQASPQTMVLYRRSACARTPGMISIMMPKPGSPIDVDLRMAEEPEQMLPQQRVAAALVGHEEAGAGIAIEQQHEGSRNQRTDRKHEQHRGDELHPHQQRQAHQRQSRRAHVDRGGQEVHSAHQERGKLERHAPAATGSDPSTPRCRWRVGGQRRVAGPAARPPAPAGTKNEAISTADADSQRPERHHVEPREGHVVRPDHQRNQVSCRTRRAETAWPRRTP